MIQWSSWRYSSSSLNEARSCGSVDGHVVKRAWLVFCFPFLLTRELMTVCCCPAFPFRFWLLVILLTHGFARHSLNPFKVKCLREYSLTTLRYDNHGFGRAHFSIKWNFHVSSLEIVICFSPSLEARFSHQDTKVTNL